MKQIQTILEEQGYLTEEDKTFKRGDLIWRSNFPRKANPWIVTGFTFSPYGSEIDIRPCYKDRRGDSYDTMLARDAEKVTALMVAMREIKQNIDYDVLRKYGGELP